MSARVPVARAFRSAFSTPLRPTRPLRPLRPTARFTSTAPTPPPTTLSGRLKSLSKEYGYAALGVYLGLSALDFPFCFLGVRLVGTERIGEYEHALLDKFRPYWDLVKEKITGRVVDKEARARLEHEGREERKNRAASIWTELALAYAIHKSLIFIRVPLTAAVTPRVVKTLRGWGWDIGKKGGIREAAAKGKPSKEKIREIKAAMQKAAEKQ